MIILHQQINPDKTLGLPPQRDEGALAQAPVLSLDMLTDTLCECCESEAQRELIRESLPKHIGAGSPYPHKEELIKKLSAVAYVLTSNEQMKALHIHTNKKISMMDSLLSDVNYCTPGFHNRVESLIHIISLPQSVDELLLAYRRVLIEDAFNDEEKKQSTNREVHTHNRFYTIASTLGYGVPCNANDPYPGTKTDKEVTAAIMSIFQRRYTPMHLSTQLVKPLLTDVLDVDPDNKEDIVHARDLACRFLGNVLRKPSINIYSMFDINKESYEIKGVDWVKVNSLVIKHLLDEKYINPIEDAHQQQYKIGEQLTLTWDTHDQTQALLTFQTKDEDDLDITYQGYLFAPSRENLIHRVSQKDKEALLEMAYKNLLTAETATHWIVLSADINQSQHKLGELIRNNVSSVKAYNAILSQLDNAGRQAIIEASREWLPKIVRSSKDFSAALCYFSPEQRTDIFDIMNKSLPKMIQSGDDVGAVLELMSPEQCSVVINTIKNKLPKIMRSGKNFGAALHSLSREQSTAVIDAMKDALPKIIKSGHSFSEVLRYLSREQRTTAIHAMKASLPNIIKSGQDIGFILEILSREQRTTVIHAMKNSLPNIIKSGQDFSVVLETLSREQRIAVFDIMKNTLPKIIQSGIDFSHALSFLQPEQCKAACLAINERLLKIFQSGKDFGAACVFLPINKCTIISEAMKDTLPEIMQSGEGFAEVLRCLSPEKRVAVFDALKDTLPKIIRSGGDFNCALHFLLPEQRATVFNAMSDTLPSVIKDAYDLFTACRILNNDQARNLVTAWCKSSKSNFIGYLSFKKISQEHKELSIEAILNNNNSIARFKSLYQEHISKNAVRLFRSDFASTLPADRDAAIKMIIKNALRNPKSRTAAVLFDMLQKSEEPTHTQNKRLAT